jgi:dTDP-4-dehydrorhamnose reductase
VNVLLTGAGGMLAHALAPALAERQHSVTALARRELDVTDGAHVYGVLRAARPDVVVQCAAYARVDDAERDESSAFAVNATGAAHVAGACREIGARFVYPSSDYVFDGRSRTPYAPAAPTAPRSAYGRTKLAGEAASREAGDYLIVRTSWLYGHGGRHFVGTILGRARAGAALRVVDDQRGAPTWTRDLAVLVVSLLEQDVPAGVYHATNAGDASWFELAAAALRLAGLNAVLTPVSTAVFADTAPTFAERPQYSVLDCTATYAITGAAPHWHDALARAVRAGVHEC